jgi:hypothetical protein
MGEVAVGSGVGWALRPLDRTGLRVGKIAGKHAACAATDARDFAHPTS